MLFLSYRFRFCQDPCSLCKGLRARFGCRGGSGVQSQQTQESLPRSRVVSPSQSFIHVVNHLTQNLLNTTMSCHATVQNTVIRQEYRHNSICVEPTSGLWGRCHPPRPGSWDPVTRQCPHFLNGGCGKISFYYISKEAKLNFFQRNFFSC